MTTLDSKGSSMTSTSLHLVLHVASPLHEQLNPKSFTLRSILFTLLCFSSPIDVFQDGLPMVTLVMFFRYPS